LNKIVVYTTIFLLLYAGLLNAQDVIELKSANELSGKVVNGKSIREANGKVHLVQGNISVYCNSATQWIDENKVELRGNVRIVQDTLTLITSQGMYYGNERRATGQGGIILQDPNATLTANNGTYTFLDGKAIFRNNVKIVNPGYTITSDELTYFRFTEDSYAKGNVMVTTDSAVITANSIDFLRRSGITKAFDRAKIESDSTIITADSLLNYRRESRSIASGNVVIISLRNNAIISGDYGENFELINYSYIRGNAQLEQIEQGSDTLIIYSEVMEAYRNNPEYYVAKDNVELIRGEFIARCGRGVYLPEPETVALTLQPVVWQENSQMTGDSIYAEFPGNVLQQIYVSKLPDMKNSVRSFVLTKNENRFFEDRTDQASGNYITMNFKNDKLNLVEIFGDASSIYFLYEKGMANGVNIINGRDMVIYLDESESVEKINVMENPAGQYVPEAKIDEVNLRLPGFEIRNDRPVRKSN
jgi:OstA-like protein.